MGCIVRVFDINETKKDYYQQWLNNVNTFLSNIDTQQSPISIRTWEYGVPLKDTSLNSTDICLDTGSYNTYIGAYISNFIQRIYLTDSFAWSKRDYIKEYNRPLPAEWKTAMEKINDNIIVQQANLQKLSFDSNFFDKVFCFSTIEHVLEDKAAIVEIWRVLKKGGQLIFTTDISPTGYKFAEFNRVYSPDSIRQLFNLINVDLPVFELPPKTQWAYNDFTCMSIVIDKE